MSVTGVILADRAAILRQIDRLVASEVLHGSESLCKLLRYLGDHAVEFPGTSVKEYQIATEVFGRSRDFDPRLDSTVRVQTGRLRAKLAEYYNGGGAEDRIIIDVPKGAYALQVRYKPEPEAHEVKFPLAPIKESQAPEGKRVSSDAAPVWILVAVSVVLAIALVYVLATRPRPVAATPPVAVELALQTFWGDFIDTPDSPWVVFSNAEFIGRPETGLRYFDPAHDSRDRILDHYTGVGEVIAIHELDRVFGQLGRKIRVKRGRQLSLEDAKNTDIVFVGSPSENLALRDTPITQDFPFRVLPDGPRKGDLAIWNLRPQRGEPTRFVAESDLPLSEDYALVSITPGLNPAMRVMVLAGTTTIGTQAAAEFATRPKDVEDLIARLGGPKNGHMPPFEAVLHVKVSKGVPVQSEIAALHKR